MDFLFYSLFTAFRFNGVKNAAEWAVAFIFCIFGSNGLVLLTLLQFALSPRAELIRIPNVFIAVSAIAWVAWAFWYYVIMENNIRIIRERGGEKRDSMYNKWGVLMILEALFVPIIYVLPIMLSAD